MENPFDAGYYCSEELRRFGFKQVGDGVKVAKNCTIVGLENISIGDNSRIDGLCTIIAVGGGLVIGRYVHIHTSNVIGCAGGVEFEDFSATSHACHVLSGSDDFGGEYMAGSVAPAFCRKPTIAPVRLGRHVVVGTHCTILPGVTLAEGVAVCSHSLIVRDLPEWSVCSGIPARFAKARSRRILSYEATIDAEKTAAAA